MCVGDIKAVPRLHGKRGWRNESFASGGRAKVRSPSTSGEEAEKARLWLDVSKMKEGTPVYRGKRSERQTICLDARACRVSSPHLSKNRAHATPSHLFEGRTG
jgi:hypothetical protein